MNRFNPTTIKTISDDTVVVPKQGYIIHRRTVVTEETILAEIYDRKIQQADVLVTQAQRDKADAVAEKALILPDIKPE